ncbi:MAG: hypothetical protein JXB07_01695 [Anaerolineae bacterium]|nr:hypothetical protein [Anaerolineae bacterium]
MKTPTLIYLGMGTLVAMIMLEGTDTKGYRRLDWLKFMVNAARITLLWPLVLFVEKLKTWLSPFDEVPEHDH